MAQKLDDSISAKLGNCFEVVNEEKKKGNRNKVKWQSDKYILVHVKHADSDQYYQWLFTEKEFSKLVSVGMTKTLGKYIDKGKLYTMSIGHCSRYIVKVQNLKKEEIVISVGIATADRLCDRADEHPESIVKLKKSLFGIFG